VTYKETPTYHVWLEPIEERLYVHVIFKDKKLSVIKEVKELLEAFPHTLYAAVWNPRLERYAKMMGLNDTGERMDGIAENGMKRVGVKIYKREGV